MRDGSRAGCWREVAMRFRLWGLLAAGLILLPACGGGPAATTRHADVFELRDLVESTGYQGSAWEVVATPVNAKERAQCGGVVLSIHTSA